jgi:hypothetical protein
MVRSLALRLAFSGLAAVVTYYLVAIVLHLALGDSSLFRCFRDVCGLADLVGHAFEGPFTPEDEFYGAHGRLIAFLVTMAF